MLAPFNPTAWSKCFSAEKYGKRGRQELSLGTLQLGDGRIRSGFVMPQGPTVQLSLSARPHGMCDMERRRDKKGSNKSG